MKKQIRVSAAAASALLVLASFIPVQSLFSQQNVNPFTIGEIRKQKSSILNEERTLYISLPRSYERSTQSYPVLYLLDAESHFYYVAGMMRFLAENSSVPEMIVIGIENIDRNRDFTPTHTDAVPVSGKADSFIRYLNEEVIPYVGKNFRASDYRIIHGHSLGGMFALYLLGRHPDMFEAYITIAPWLIYDNHFIVKDLETSLMKLSVHDKFLYMTLGNEPLIFPDMDSLRRILKEKAPKNLNWSFQLFEQEDHNTVPLNSLFYGMKKLFADWSVTDELAAEGADSIGRHFSRLSAKFGFEIRVPENRLNASGYNYIGSKKIREAVAVLLYNTRLYPESANTFDSLGDAYEASGENQKAVECAEKALDLLRKNTALDDNTRKGITASAQDKLKRLKK